MGRDPVEIFKARRFARGGVVETRHGRPPKFVTMKLPTAGVDRIPALLQGGELVIPKRLAPRVVSYLASIDERLPRVNV